MNNGFPATQMEILVVDGISSDNTRSIVNRLSVANPKLRLIDNPKKKTPFALNLGIEHANNEYILIASAHSSFDTGYISILFDEMKKHNSDVIGGVMETKVQNLTLTSKAIKEVLSNKFGVGNALFRTGIKEAMEVDTVPFGIYKTKLLKEVGGYNTQLIRNHDIELSKRLLKKGLKIMLTPATKCSYYARESFSQLAQNNFRNGKWNLLTVFITKDFTSLSVRHFIPLIFVLSILIPMLLSVFYFPFIYLSFLAFFTYLLALIGVTIKTVELKYTTFFHVIRAFFSLHFSYGIGSLVGLFGFFKHKQF